VENKSLVTAESVGKIVAITAEKYILEDYICKAQMTLQKL